MKTPHTHTLKSRTYTRSIAASLISLSLLELNAATITVPVNGNIQQALDSANDGDTVELLAGTYNIGSPLIARKRVTLVGAGRDNTTIQPSNNFWGQVLLYIEKNGTNVRMIEFDAKKKMDGNVRTNLTTGTQVVNCSLKNSRTQLLKGKSNGWGNFTNLYVSGTYFSGTDDFTAIGINGKFVNRGPASAITLVGDGTFRDGVQTMYNAKLYGNNFAGGTGVTFDFPGGADVEDTTLPMQNGSQGWTGLKVGGTSQWQQNQFSGGSELTFVSIGGASVQRNQFTGSNTAWPNSYFKIHLEDSNKDIFIVGNTFSGGDSGDRIIHSIAKSLANSSDGVTIANNTFSGTSRDMVFMQNAKNVDISGVQGGQPQEFYLRLNNITNLNVSNYGKPSVINGQTQQ